MKRLSVLGILFFLTLFLMSCGGTSEPPYFGVFLEDDGELLEMVEFRGKPDSPTANGIPSTTNSEPVIVMWYPDVNLDYLNMSSLTGAGRVDFNVRPRDGDILEIRPSAPLGSDTYCLRQGDPLRGPQDLSNWCFRIGLDTVEISPTVLPTSTLTYEGGRALALSQLPQPAVDSPDSCAPITGDWKEPDGTVWNFVEIDTNVYQVKVYGDTGTLTYHDGFYNNEDAINAEIRAFCYGDLLIWEIVGAGIMPLERLGVR